MRYHVSASGEPAKCQASTRDCPLGGDHFETEADARAHIEKTERERANGPFGASLSRSGQAPMTYTVDIDTSVFDADGEEWVVVSKYYGRTNSIAHMLPTIGLAKVPSGEELLLDPYDPAGGVSVADFTVAVSAPKQKSPGKPRRASMKYEEVPLGASRYEDVLLQTVPVKQDGETIGRYLLVEKSSSEAVTDEQLLEISEAMWDQTGSEEDWHSWDEERKLKYARWHGQAYDMVMLDNDGANVVVSTPSANGNTYPAVEDPVPVKDIVKYKL